MDASFFEIVSGGKLRTSQQKDILKTITSKQFRSLRSFANNILSGKIKLSDSDFKTLSKHRTFIRRFNRGEVTRDTLGYKHNRQFIELIKVYLGHNEGGPKNGVSTSGTVGNGQKGPSKEKVSIRRGGKSSQTDYTESDTTSENSTVSSEGDTESIDSYETGNSGTEGEDSDKSLKAEEADGQYREKEEKEKEEEY